MTRPFRKKLNPKLIEKHRCYRAEDLAEVFQVHKHTVFTWLKNGLPQIDGKIPYTVFGGDLISWIYKNRPAKQKKSDPSKVYCVKCRDHVLFDYENSWIKEGGLKRTFSQSRCPVCECIVNKISPNSDKKNQEAEKRLTCSTPTTLNTHKRKGNHDAAIQRKERADQIPLF
ncbi:hypothetical protein DID80_04920 [Candidatus Marinamargulisbacteria bacterium SCGC AAA071-K20]|nr:hypothetical protein DID80_04920 [Candidatus Marinamargulisbacteria bacterium SCGC AAA071-K20]